VTVTKAGYQTVTQTVTAAAIQAYVNAPLDVYLKNRYSLVNKLSSNSDMYTKDECVKDDFTGLMWEGKTISGLRSATNTYTNYEDGRVNDTSEYVNAVNQFGLCGHSDWRMPTFDELFSIVDKDSTSLIDMNFFPNSVDSVYWTSSVACCIVNTRAIVNFAAGGSGTGGGYFVSNTAYVRLVRSSP
jgi:hypothetical protein